TRTSQKSASASASFSTIGVLIANSDGSTGFQSSARTTAGAANSVNKSRQTATEVGAASRRERLISFTFQIVSRQRSVVNSAAISGWISVRDKASARFEVVRSANSTRLEINDARDWLGRNASLLSRHFANLTQGPSKAILPLREIPDQ